ncbi:MAG: rubredoxin-like domain-containing protein [Spirochaetia bacterium]
MAELMRCRSCGYVTEAARVGDVCPACGVPRKLMEPWKDPVSEQRRLLLWLDVHPIVDHFSVSFSASAFVLSLVALILPGFYPDTLTAIISGFLGVLPLAVIASFVTGIFDARVRFRRSSTPILSRKKIYGLAFFLFSTAAAVIVFTVGPYVPWARAADAIALSAGVVCAVRLGRIGQGLLPAIFPG